MIGSGMLQPEAPPRRRPSRRISEVADSVGLSTHALRYYERAGLIDPIDRAESGHRRFSDEDLDWIMFVTRLRATGMPIRRLQEYAALRRRSGGTDRRQLALLERHRDEVVARMHDLQRNLGVIEQTIETCRSQLRA
jgi:DNA-binding transcriptional MerR regulator